MLFVACESPRRRLPGGSVACILSSPQSRPPQACGSANSAAGEKTMSELVIPAGQSLLRAARCSGGIAPRRKTRERRLGGESVKTCTGGRVLCNLAMMWSRIAIL